VLNRAHRFDLRRCDAQCKRNSQVKLSLEQFEMMRAMANIFVKLAALDFITAREERPLVYFTNKDSRS